jgi:hypothetical protein
MAGMSAAWARRIRTLIVILSKRSLRSEGSGRAARSVAACPELAEWFFATQ